MAEYTNFFPTLALSAALLVVALAAAPLFERIRLPSPAAFLAVGITAGLLGIAPTKDLPIATLERVGAVALFVILFQGGLSTGFKAARSVARPVLSLGIVGTVATAGGLALVAHFVLRLDWSVALLIAVALAPTDPAAVYALLRGRSGSDRARTVLEGESGFNDPAGIALMVAVVATVGTSQSSYQSSLWRFVEQLSIGTAAGAAGGFALIAILRHTPRFEGGVRATALLLAAVLLGAATMTIHGSGFLAVYVAGLLLSDSWAGQESAARAVPETVSSVAEPLLFVTLGAAFAPLIGAGDLGRGILLTLVTVFAVRPVVASVLLIGSGLSRPDRGLVSWGGLKGAVPLLLAGYPALEHFSRSSTVAGTVLVATAASLVVQGGTLPLIADRAAARERS